MYMCISMGMGIINSIAESCAALPSQTCTCIGGFGSCFSRGLQQLLQSAAGGVVLHEMKHKPCEANLWLHHS